MNRQCQAGNAGNRIREIPGVVGGVVQVQGRRQGWSCYTDFPDRLLAIKHAAARYIYLNTQKAMLLTGAGIQEWLEVPAGQFNLMDPSGALQQDLCDSAFPSFNFDTVDGVCYVLDLIQSAKYAVNGRVAAATANRVEDLRYDGTPIKADAKFLMATNNNHAFGGGNFPGLSA